METPQDMQNVPNVPNAGMEEHHMNPNKVIIPVLLALVVILAGYFVLRSNNGVGELYPNGVVTQTDLETSLTKIPTGFPDSIPVQGENVKESYKVDYEAEKVTQYTVAFSSELTQEEVWKTYADLFLSLGYASGEGDIDEGKGVMKGYRDGNKLNIAVSPYDTGSYVTINFIERHE